MSFTKEEYAQKYETMFALTEECITIFKEIIQDERDRIDRQDPTLDGSTEE